MLLVIFCLIRPIYSLFAKADFPDAIWDTKTAEEQEPWIELADKWMEEGLDEDVKTE